MKLLQLLKQQHKFAQKYFDNVATTASNPIIPQTTRISQPNTSKAKGITILLMHQFEPSNNFYAKTYLNQLLQRHLHLPKLLSRFFKSLNFINIEILQSSHRILLQICNFTQTMCEKFGQLSILSGSGRRIQLSIGVFRLSITTRIWANSMFACNRPWGTECGATIAKGFQV